MKDYINMLENQKEVFKIKLSCVKGTDLASNKIRDYYEKSIKTITNRLKKESKTS